MNDNKTIDEFNRKIKRIIISEEEIAAAIKKAEGLQLKKLQNIQNKKNTVFTRWEQWMIYFSL